MVHTTWAVSDDGEFEYISLTQEYIEESMEVMRKSYLLHESVAMATKLCKYPEAMKEMEELLLHVAKDGVSVIAIETKTGNVAAVLLNKIEVPLPQGESSYYEVYKAKCKTPSARAYVGFVNEIATKFELFRTYDIDCFMEVMFGSTLPEYRGKGLAKTLVEISIRLARNLKNGENVKCSLTSEKLELEPVPKIICGVFKSNISRKIAKRLGFETLDEIPYDRWSFDGIRFDKTIGPQTKLTMEVYKL